MSLKVPSVGKRGGRKRFYSCVCCGAVQIDAQCQLENFYVQMDKKPQT